MFIKIAGVESIYSLKSGRLSNERLSIIATDAIAIKAYIIKEPIKSHAIHMKPQTTCMTMYAHI